MAAEPGQHAARARCLEARDAFFACADSELAGDVKAAQSAPACAAAWESLRAACPGSWVRYFCERREWRAKRDSRQAGGGAGSALDDM
eukprot:PLAT10385.1.p2 GENE.PLAT10385.1~~PLAT10385.1.p2  ORF type:complete len:101 (-),score=27.42 PLAT10385.1:82-345(-)